MDDLTTTQGIVALAAAGVALIALILAIVLALKLRSLRRAQTMVLGDGAARDLVTHSAQLDDAFVSLREYVEEALARLEERSRASDERIDNSIAYRALVRYDAYGEMSGAQSSSIALLDKHHSGIVVSSIMHRDQARVYVKEVHAGESSIELSPEEQQAIEQALGAA